MAVDVRGSALAAADLATRYRYLVRWWKIRPIRPDSVPTGHDGVLVWPRGATTLHGVPCSEDEAVAHLLAAPPAPLPPAYVDLDGNDLSCYYRSGYQLIKATPVVIDQGVGMVTLRFLWFNNRPEWCWSGDSCRLLWQIHHRYPLAGLPADLLSQALLLPTATTREEARAKGLTRYFTGRPCWDHGHIAERKANTGYCVLCLKASRTRRTRRIRQSPPGSQADRDRNYAIDLAARCLSWDTNILWEVDHHMPLCLGGTNDTGNLRLVPAHINGRKSGQHPDRFWPAYIAAGCPGVPVPVYRTGPRPQFSRRAPG